MWTLLGTRESKAEVLVLESCLLQSLCVSTLHGQEEYSLELYICIINCDAGDGGMGGDRKEKDRNGGKEKEGNGGREFCLLGNRCQEKAPSHHFSYTVSNWEWSCNSYTDLLPVIL